MPFLVSAVVLIGMLCLFDLLLTLGVIRRLKEHTSHLEELLGAAPETVQGAMPRPGDKVADFAVTALDGEPVTRADLEGRTLVAFFAQGCDVCQEKLPGFVTEAESWPGGRRQVLAVVSGSAAEVTAFTDRLSPVARVVVEEDEAAVIDAFGMRAFPAFCVVDSAGTVLAAEIDLGHLRATATA